MSTKTTEAKLFDLRLTNALRAERILIDIRTVSANFQSLL